MTNQEIYNDITKKHMKRGDYGIRHYKATLTSPVGMLIVATIGYLDDYYQRYESHVGDDRILGPAIREVLHSIQTLLNGELGDLDGGICSEIIQAIAFNSQLTSEKGEEI